jgi:hypothetical protein
MSKQKRTTSFQLPEPKSSFNPESEKDMKVISFWIRKDLKLKYDRIQQRCRDALPKSYRDAHPRSDLGKHLKQMIESEITAVKEEDDDGPSAA